jgi:hypothetical protein
MTGELLSQAATFAAIVPAGSRGGKSILVIVMIIPVDGRATLRLQERRRGCRIEPCTPMTRHEAAY